MFDSATGNKLITGEPLEWNTNNGVPAVIRDQTNPLYSWLRQVFDVRTTIGLAENLVAYQLPQDRNIAGDLVSLLNKRIINEFRSTVYHGNLIPFLRALKPARSPDEECYPLSAIKIWIRIFNANWNNTINIELV